MALTLSKGQNISLSKENFPMQFTIGLGWDANSTDTGADFDLDASVVLVQDNGLVSSDGDFVFYNALQHASGAVIHEGDNRTGVDDATAGADDETIRVDLAKMPSNLKKMVVFTTIHEADKRNQSFGQVRNAYIRLLNPTTGQEMLRFDLSEDFSTETAVICAEIYLHNSEWKMRAVSAGYKGGLPALLAPVGIIV